MTLTYPFSPSGSILQLQDQVQDQQSAGPAPAAYFCVQKQDLDQVSQSPWGGSSAPSSQVKAKNDACTLSLRSVNSEDSGHASGGGQCSLEVIPNVSTEMTNQSLHVA